MGALLTPLMPVEPIVPVIPSAPVLHAHANAATAAGAGAADPNLTIPVPIPGVPDVHIPTPHINPVGTVLSALGKVLASGVQSVAAWAFDGMTHALLATTNVNLLGSWFDGPWRAMITVAAVLSVPVLLFGVISEVMAGRPAGALRRGVLIPLAVAPMLLAARAVLALMLTVINGSCALVVQVGIGGNAGFASSLDRMRRVLGVSGVGIPGANGVALLFVVLIATFLSFVIWIELAVRAALIYLLVAFIPLTIAGLFWQATSRWTRRLLEVLAAVVLAQLVITVVMVLAAASLGGHADGLAQGIDQVAVGLALLFLGTLGLPMTLRLLPHVVEASVAAGVGASVAHSVRRHSGQMLMAVPHPAARLAGGAVAGRTDLVAMGSRAAVVRGPQPSAGTGGSSSPASPAGGSSSGSATPPARTPVAAASSRSGGAS